MNTIIFKWHSNLSNQIKFRLNNINEIKDFQLKNLGKKKSKYIAALDYLDKTLIVLSATSGGISIVSFTSVIGVPIGIASASFSLVSSLTTGIIKKLLTITRNEKKINNGIVISAKTKLNSIESLKSQALIDLKISHEEFKTIINKTGKY